MTNCKHWKLELICLDFFLKKKKGLQTFKCMYQDTLST